MYVSKKSDFSGGGNLIQLSFVSNEAGGDIFESGFLYIRLPWFLVHKIIKLRIGSPPPKGSFF